MNKNIRLLLFGLLLTAFFVGNALAVAPEVTDVSPTDITHESAKINYNVNQSDAGTRVEYGITEALDFSSGWYNSSPYSVTVTGLNPNTKYYYSVFAYNSSTSEYSNSTIQFFTTDPAPVVASAPTVLNIQPSSTHNSARITYSVDQSPANTQVLYGKTPSFDLVSGWNNGSSPYTVDLLGLDADTTYYYSVFAYNSTNLSYYSNSTIGDFTTGSAPTPVVPTAPSLSSVNSSDVKYDSAKINYIVNQSTAKTRIAYGKTQSLGLSSDWFSGSSVNNRTISGLDSGTTYYYSVFAYNSTDETKYSNSSIESFTTTSISGDRIWEAGMSTTYEWNAKTFSGFFYDLETGLFSETMRITDISRTIGDGKLVYRTQSVESNFEHSGWGKYDVIGFMAEKYFAGYTSNTTINGVDTVSLISSGQLSKVLLDNDDKKSVYSGSSLTLEDGYKLNIVQVDRNGDKVFVTLTKDGDELDSAVISGSGDYIYKTDLGDSDDVVIVAVRFTSIFSGTESNAVTIQGIFQISEDYIELEDGASYGKMEITGFSENYIEMKNDGSISLSKGKTIPIMGKIKFIVADSNTLRFAPFVDMSTPGTYELRGTVAEGLEKLTWTPLNFEGFYYDIDEGIQTEKLELIDINDRSIPKNKLVYTSTPKPVSFEHSSWGSFNVIGFMAEKYFAGYPSGAFGSSSSVDILSDGLLSKVLIDEDDKKSVYSGSSLVLEEGYALNIVQVDKNGDKVMVTLTKDGDEVDTSIISGSGTYIYEKDLGDSDDVPLIAIHFDSIFSGTESNAVFVKGIFQISEDYLEIEDGDTFGKMEVTGIGGSITMSNKDSISLSKGKSIAIMGDVSINVADSSDVRYYPYVEVTTTPSQSLSVSLDNSITTKGSKVTVTVTSRGAAVSEATVKAGSSTVGTTDDEGRITYTASTIGTIKITASKDGYASGSSELEIISPDDDSRKIILEVSPQEVYEGSSVTFFVLKAIGGDAVEGATVSYDGKSIGSTSSQGTVTYTVTNPGMHKLTAVKSGFLDASMNLEVKELAAKFEFTNLVITPLDVRQGKEATFSVDVKNVGTAAGNYTVDLKVNDTVVGTKTVSLGIGESETLEFKHAEKEPGTYTVKVADLTTTYEVFERSGVIWYALGAIAVVIVGGLGYLFTAGGWTVDMAQAKVDEAIQTIKELVSKR
jgi:S-layer protein (TIGR01567 family)